MKIFVVSQYFWPEDFRFNDLIFSLADHGFQIDVLTGIPNYPSGNFAPNYRPLFPFIETHKNVKIYRVPLVARKTGKIFLALNYLSFLFLSLLMTPYFVFRKYDAVITLSQSPAFATTAGVLVAKLKRIPSYTWLLDMWPESLQAVGIIKNKKIIDLLRPFFIILYRSHSFILSQSKSFSSHLLNHGVLQKQIIYFPNWAEETYKPVDTKTDENNYKILYAGNLGDAQDLPTLLNAAEKLKAHANWQWIILGDGRMKDWLTTEVRERKLDQQIKILGRKPQSEMPEWFAQADIMYVSLKENPIMDMTLPGRVQSFMASAKPILAVANGETATIITDANCGFAVSAGDVNQLVLTIEKILNTKKSDLATLGRNGYQYYKSYFLRENRIQQIIRLLTSNSTK